MAPLGILTAVVGAIRVDGANWLKELVGRARETTSGAEIELMSSVSQEVCEVWNGTSIVRSMGSPQVKQIIHLPAGKEDFSPESFITMDRKTWSREYELKARCLSAKDTGSENLSTNEDDNVGMEKGYKENTVHPLGDEELIKNKEIPPNISLNIHGGSNPVELVVYALIASILQTAVLGWSSYAHKHKLSGSNPSVGFSLQAAGTVLLTLGLALCAGVIDNGSRERHWMIEGEPQVRTMSELLSFANFKFQALANKLRLSKDKSLQEKKPFRRRHMQLYWVQKQHIAGDNSFDPYILYAEELNDKVHESHRAKENGQNDQDDNVHRSQRAKETVQKDRDNKFLRKLLRLFGRHLTTFAVVIALLGFVAQFQGLRFSNWTCSIAQLIALGFTTILRAWVRRTMTKTPVAIPVDNDYIIAHLTLAIVGRERSDSKFPHHEAFRSPGLSLRFGITTCPKLRVITEEPTNSESRSTTKVQDSTKAEKKPNLAQEALNLRVRLGRITKWTGAKSQEAIVLSNSVETALRMLNPRLPAEFGKKCAVVLQVDTYRTMSYLPSSSEPHFQEEVELYIIKDGDVWKVDDGQLEALLSLVSYSVWAAEQNKRSQAETNRGKSLARSESSGHPTKESSFEDSQSIGWLRAKAPDSRIYDIIIGKSSPRLMSDLHWWVSDTKQDLKKAKTVHNGMVTRVLADSTGPLSDAEANWDKVERPALGFVEDETLGENGMVTIQRRLWRVLTSPDIYCSWECNERQVAILHLFSTFIWATAPYLSASQFHPTTVISPTSTSEHLTRSSLKEAQLKSDNIKTLVQELQSTGLATCEEIYKMIVPPLSHFAKLPNEAVADWCNEIVIETEASLEWNATFKGYMCLLDKVRDREAQDRFSTRVAAMFVEFLLRVNEEPSGRFVRWGENSELTKFNACLKDRFENKNLLKAILSVNNILSRRWHLREDDCARLILRELGFENTPGEIQTPDLPLQGLCPSDNTSKNEDFSFPNDTDVFGWTKDYRDIFETTEPVSASRLSDCSALDLAGRSVLHNKIDSNRKTHYSDKYRAYFLYGGHGTSRNLPHLRNDSMYIARCNKQTPLHRTARGRTLGVVVELLEQGADPDAADHFGRTALCLAAHHGDSQLVRKLYGSMKPDGRARTDRNSRNALHYAILNQKEEAALSLIEGGIDINAEDFEGRSPLWYAASKGMQRTVESLLVNDKIKDPDLRRDLQRERWSHPTVHLTAEELAWQEKVAQMAKTKEWRKKYLWFRRNWKSDGPMAGPSLWSTVSSSDLGKNAPTSNPQTKAQVSPHRDESRTTATTYPRFVTISQNETWRPTSFFNPAGEYR